MKKESAPVPYSGGIRIQTPFFGERNSTDGPLGCQGREPSIQYETPVE